MSSEARIALAETLAEWVDSLVRVSFARIGSLYQASSLSSSSQQSSDITGYPTHAQDVACHKQQPAPPLITSGPFSNLSTPPPTNASRSESRSTVKEAGNDDDDKTNVTVILGPLIFQPFFGDWRLDYPTWMLLSDRPSRTRTNGQSLNLSSGIWLARSQAAITACLVTAPRVTT